MPPENQSKQVGQYYLMEKIAQGGMAEIYKGLSYDVHGLKKTVCIKKILPQLSADKEFIASLVDEAKLAVQLVHGNIAQTFDLGKVGDDYYMVMEFVDGKSLSQIHKKCQGRGNLIPVPCLIYFLSELLTGLDYIHRRTDKNGRPLHIVHRDISPQNIMVSYSGTVKVIDFGIAKVAVKAGSTDSGILKGKFAYMSPEQAYGDALDQRSDIFSAGIILHEMLTGRRLFKADDSRETIRNVRRCRVDPPSSIRPELGEEMDRIVMRALAKDRRHRYPFASDMHADLVKYLYTSHPDFKPSDAADFVHELFRDEAGRASALETDARTPHLIIDRSNSALADDSQFESTGIARAPMDMGEYMLEEPTVPRPAGAEEGESRPPDEVEGGPGDEEEEEFSEKIRRPRRRWRLPTHVKIMAAFSVVAVAAAAALFLLRDPSIEVAAPEKTVDFAELIVVTDPADATVSVDGKNAGSGSPVTIRELKPDEEHILLVERKGYVPYERRFKLSAGEFVSATVALTRAAEETATLEIASTPPGATVFIDDRETSYKTPASIAGIDTRKAHEIGLHLSGHRFWSRSVEFRPGETKIFDINMGKDLGSLFVDSTPQKALVMIDGMPVGQTPLNREELEPDRVYKVEVWLEGYKPSSEEIKAIAGRKLELRMVLAPEPRAKETEPAGPPAPGGGAAAPAQPVKVEKPPAIEKPSEGVLPGSKAPEPEMPAAPAAPPPPDSAAKPEGAARGEAGAPPARGLLEEPAPMEGPR